MLYCKAKTGSFFKISAEILPTSSVGNASGAGFPAAKEMTSGSAVYFKISLIAEA